jgi:hypothetical protein
VRPSWARREQAWHDFSTVHWLIVGTVGVLLNGDQPVSVARLHSASASLIGQFAIFTRK